MVHAHAIHQLQYKHKSKENSIVNSWNLCKNMEMTLIK
jgi:hypothetical protein